MKYWKAVRKTNKNNIFQTGGIGGSEKTDFKVGETYEVSGEPELCNNGFHFYKQENFVFGLSLFGNKIIGFLEIEPLSEVVSDTEKCVSTKIKILRYVPKKEWQKLVKKGNNSGNQNSGDRNSGHQNSGNHNSGDRNSGSWNSGNYNSGNWNSGYQNSGHYNSRDRNSGNWNSGNHNSGDGNSGYRNSGNWNSGHYNSGNRNSGNQNSGHYNSRDYNSGNRNSGNQNSGHYNSGDGNSGNWNSGDRNSGNWNSGNHNSGNWNSGDGYKNFCCSDRKWFLFNIEVSEQESNQFLQINMSWFSLTDKTYQEAWSLCPPEILEELKRLPILQTKKGQENFKLVTGL